MEPVSPSVDWNEPIHLIHQYPNDTLTAIGFLTTAVYILDKAPTIQAGLNQLAVLTHDKRILVGENDQFIIVSEIQQGETEPIFIIQSHLQPDYIGKNSVYIQSNLDDISKYLGIRLSASDVLHELNAKAETIDSARCDEEFSKYFRYVDYTWYEITTQDIIRKRAFGVKYRKNGSEYLIVSGFNLTSVEDSVMPTGSTTTSKWIIGLSVFFVWMLLCLVIKTWYRTPYTSGQIIVFVLLGLVVAYTSSQSIVSISSPSREVEFGKELDSRALTVTATSIGISVLLSYTDYSNPAFVAYLFLSFFFSLFAQIYPQPKGSPEELRNYNLFRQILINLSIGFICLATIKYLFYTYGADVFTPDGSLTIAQVSPPPTSAPTA